MLGRGETLGVFQLESDGMKRVCVELKPSGLDDIIALVALYRPGPMDWIPDYIANKHGRKTPKYLHPKLVPILSDTYGIACYQEQVMQIARDLAGFTMGQADELRKVMGKKQKDKIPYYREQFITGCAANGIDADAGGGHLRVHRTVRGLRLQQVARRRIRLDRLSDGDTSRRTTRCSTLPR